MKGKDGSTNSHTFQSGELTKKKKKDILVCYVNCKSNKGTKNNDITSKNQKGRIYGAV